MMGPQRKVTRTHGLVGGTFSSLGHEEPKDYINELSHEVLCHIFRSVQHPNTPPLVSAIVSSTVLAMLVLSVLLTANYDA